MKLFLTPAILCTGIAFSSCGKNSGPSLPGNPATDSFKVAVTHGYGSGTYKAGDTVHIFSEAYNSNTQVFGSWSGGDASLLQAPAEWHTWFVMPAKNVSFTGTVNSMQPFTLTHEQIQGRDHLKSVYYYFPADHTGIVYLLHGTGGSAANLVASYEWQLMINDLVNNKYAVIITESEETTINGSDTARWSNTPWDTITNVDFANIRIITNTFYNRGVTDISKSRYSIGMSNGGNFSTALSTIYKFKSGVSYCAPSGNAIAQSTTTPLQFCMAQFDNNPNVGPAGNANALNNANTIAGRGICSNYLIKIHSPLYPERFARHGDISVEQSAAIFNELKANGLLDAKNYFKGYTDDFLSAYQSNPSAFPQISSLSPNQKITVNEQITLSVSDHHMYSDYNKATLAFLEEPCSK